MGNRPSGTHSDSDEDDYDTPPETLDSDNDLEEENDDPNVPENSDDDISEDEDNEVLHNRPENDSAISVGNLINSLHLLMCHFPAYFEDPLCLHLLIFLHQNFLAH